MNQSEDNSTKILVIILAVLGGGMLVCCGVGVGVFFWMRTTLQGMGDMVDMVDDGTGGFDRQVQVEIESNPVILEHIGEVTHFESDSDLYLDEPVESVWVFHISGDRGDGILRAECITVDAWSESVPRAELTLDNGEVFQLFPDNPLPAENQRDIGVRFVIENNPVIVQHIGTITRFESDYDLWINEPGMDVWPFHIEGEKGSGLLRAECLTDDNFIYEVPSAELKLKSGEVIQLFPENPLEALDEIDVGMGEMDGGLSEFDGQVKVAVKDHPAIVERIGTIDSFRSDFDLSMNEPGEDVWVFQITGENGSGRLRAECITIDADTEDVPSAELTLESGEVIQLYPDNPLE